MSGALVTKLRGTSALFSVSKIEYGFFEFCFFQRLKKEQKNRMPRLMMRYGPLLFAAACEFVLQGTEIVFEYREKLKRDKEKRDGGSLVLDPQPRDGKSRM